MTCSLLVAAFLLCVAPAHSQMTVSERDLEALASEVSRDLAGFLKAKSLPAPAANKILIGPLENRCDGWDVPIGPDLRKPGFADKLTHALPAKGFHLCTSKDAGLTSFAPDNFAIIVEKTKAKWLLNGCFFEARGDSQPSVLLKLIDLTDRTMAWGGCFTVKATGHRPSVVYPETQKIAHEILQTMPEPPAPKEKEGAEARAPRRMAVWRLVNVAAEGEAADPSWLFADLLTVSLVRHSGTAGLAWLDARMMRELDISTARAVYEMSRPDGTAPRDRPLLPLEVLAAEPWKLTAVIDGSVFVSADLLGSALLKVRTTDGYVLTGYCSEGGGYARLERWIRRAGAGLDRPAGLATPASLNVRSQCPHEQFLNVAEVAVAKTIGRPKQLCKLRSAEFPHQGDPDLSLLLTSAKASPTGMAGRESLQAYLVDAKTSLIHWASDVPRDATTAPLDVDRYCRAAANDLSAALADRELCVALWALPEGEPAAFTAPWAPEIVAQKLAVSLSQKPGMALKTVGGSVFGQGELPKMLDQIDAPQKGTPAAPKLDALTIQLLPRASGPPSAAADGPSPRPAVVLKLIDPSTGFMQWAYYGPDFTSAEERREEKELHLLLRSCFRKFASPTPKPAGAGVLIDGFRDNGLLTRGRHAYELFVVEATRSSGKPALELSYVQAREPKIERGSDLLLNGNAAGRFRVGSLLQAELTRWPADAGGENRRQLIVKEIGAEDCALRAVSASPPVAVEGPSVSGLFGRVAHLLLQPMDEMPRIEIYPSSDPRVPPMPEEIVERVMAAAQRDKKGPGTVVVQRVGAPEVRVKTAIEAGDPPSLRATIPTNLPPENRRLAVWSVGIVQKGVSSGQSLEHALHQMRGAAAPDLDPGMARAILRSNLEHLLAAARDESAEQGRLADLTLVSAEAARERFGGTSTDDEARARSLISKLRLGLTIGLSVDDPRLSVLTIERGRRGLFTTHRRYEFVVWSATIRYVLRTVWPSPAAGSVVRRDFRYYLVDTDVERSRRFIVDKAARAAAAEFGSTPTLEAKRAMQTSLQKWEKEFGFFRRAWKAQAKAKPRPPASRRRE